MHEVWRVRRVGEDSQRMELMLFGSEVGEEEAGGEEGLGDA